MAELTQRPAPGDDQSRWGRRRVDRILDPAYVSDLADLPLATLRQRRAEAGKEEAALSYTRRMLQGRLDILRAAADQRDHGNTGGGVIERLAVILADPSGPSRTLGQAYAQDLPASAGEHRRAVERVLVDMRLDDPAQLDEATLAAAIAQAQAAERQLSAVRTRVLRVLDLLAAEIGRRYLSGAVDPVAALSDRTFH